MKMNKGAFWTLFLATAAKTDAFVPFSSRSSLCLRRKAPSHTLLHSSTDSSSSDSSSSDYTDTEREEMKDLILSLSLEPTDHDRRERLRDVFHEALARPNGMPKRFSDLFDLILSELGDEIQKQAKKKFFEAQAAEQVSGESNVEVSNDNEEDPNGVNNTESNTSETLKVKTPEELQLWALVDMMVQSKTIVKVSFQN